MFARRQSHSPPFHVLLTKETDPHLPLRQAGQGSGAPLVRVESYRYLPISIRIRIHVKITFRVLVNLCLPIMVRNDSIQNEAGGLAPFTTYYYQFTVCGTNSTSPVGRTMTAPAPENELSSLSLGVFSCANFGCFNAYGNTARKDSVDYVLHLGDYIYEDEVGVPGEDERAMVPAKEIVTLYDYRTRIAQYRSDPDLQAAHEKSPFITVWVSLLRSTLPLD
jgi:phosphodiesterase/alkaline phosphatase D-like protein